MLLLGLSPVLWAAADAPDARWQSWAEHQRLQSESVLRGLPWRPIGPVVMGGRVVDVEAVPGKPYSFYVAYATAGVWRTDNNGVTFKPLSDAQPTLVTGDIAVDPTRPEVLWVGSGEPNASRSSYGGLGIFRSGDGGASFQHKGLTEVDRIARIVVDPVDSTHVCVAATGRLYSAGGGRGIYCSFDDGASWAQTLKPDGARVGAIDLVLAPGEPSTLYASLWEHGRRPWNFVESGSGSGIWRSADGGRSWTRLDGFPAGPAVGRIGLAVAASQPSTIYASIDQQAPLAPEELDAGDRALSPLRLKSMSKDEFLLQDPDEVELLLRRSDLPPELTAAELIERIGDGRMTLDDLRARLSDGNSALFERDVRGIEIWRSDDAGQSWRRTHDDVLREFYYSYGYYFGQIRVAPDDPERIYVLGMPLMTSADGGRSFAGMNDPSVHVDHHAWWIDPAQPQRMLNGNDGGVDVSYDGGASWLKLDRQTVGQSYAVQFDFAEPYNVYTGMQDNGTYKGSSRAQPDDEAAWTSIGGGDGMQIQIDPRDQTVYAGSQFGFYRRSDGQGVRPVAALGEPALRFNWQTPILLSPHSPDVLYMGAQKLLRSTDRGATFSAISPDLTRSKERGDVPFATLTSIAESPLAFGRLLVGSDDGQLRLSTDAGASWQDLGRQLPDLWVSRVVLSAHASDRLYVALNGYREDDPRALLWRSDDLGRHWTSIAGGLPDEPVNVVAEDPVNPDLLYVGTDRGVYASLDRGATWMALDGGLPNVPVHDLKVHPRDRELIAGTHGRSVWVLDVLPIQELTAQRRAAELHLFAPADVKFQRGWRNAPSRWFADEPEDLPKVRLSYWARTAGPVTLEVSDARKAVLRTLSLAAVAGLNVVDWDLKLEQAPALAAEQARIQAALKDGTLKQPVNLKETPVAEAIRLGHPLYAPPATYTVALKSGESSSSATLKVEPPEAFKPRVKPAWTRREK